MDDASIGVVGSSSFKSTVIGGQWMTPALELWDHHHSSLLSENLQNIIFTQFSNSEIYLPGVI